MRKMDRSLREVVQKWFGDAALASLQITRVPHHSVARRGCVRVEWSRCGAPITVFFFRQDDGGWAVFPPRPAVPWQGRSKLAALGYVPIAT